MKKTMHRALFAALFWLATALPAWASEAEGGESNIFAGDFGNVLWTLVIFGLVLIILGKFAWGPLLEVLQKREDFIRSSLDEAKKDREAAEARLREYEERLTTARAEATAIVEEGRRDAEVLRTAIEQQARQEAESMLERTKREIGIARDTAIKELYTVGGNLATQIAARIVGRELEPKDHERLIEEAIADMNRLPSN